MKRLSVSLIFFIIFTAVYSQQISVEQQLIRKSGLVIHAAHKSFIAHGVSTGNLAKSIEHQRYAIQLFTSGNISQATYHSAYARTLGFQVYEANTGQVLKNLSFTAEENALIMNSPSHTELDKVISPELKDDLYADPQLPGVDL